MFAFRNVSAAVFGAITCVIILNCASSSAVRPGNERFLQKSRIHVNETAFEDVIGQLAEQEHLDMKLDPSVVAEGAHKVKVTLNFDGISLRSVLNLLCESITPGIQHRVDDAGRILFLTDLEEAAHFVVRKYPLTSLGSLMSDSDQLTQVLIWTTSGPWKKLDGEGGEILSTEQGVITIRQSRNVHEQIENLFLQLASVSSGHPLSSLPFETTEAGLRKSLDTMSSPHQGKISLKDFFSEVLGSQGIPYWLSPQALKEVGDAVITLDGKSRPVRETLQIALHPLKLSFEIEDEVIKIRPVGFAEDRMITKVYDIRKLAFPTRSSQEVMASLESTEEIGRWFNVDGEGGTMAVIGPLLVIRQTVMSHEKIAAVLDGKPNP